MPSPTGSVAALSSASATIFSIGIVFLGYWGMYEPTKWHVGDVMVVVIALIGFGCLGLVPWPNRKPTTPTCGSPGICFWPASARSGWPWRCR